MLPIVVFAALAGCGGPQAPRAVVSQMPLTDDEEISLEAEIDELGLSEAVIDPGALCHERSERGPTPACFTPPGLDLGAPELRDARKEPSVDYLWSPDRYARVIRILEHALVRSKRRTLARKKILGWLTTAYDRQRATRRAWAERSSAPIRGSACLIHYLELFVAEQMRPESRRLVTYTLALEHERAGHRDKARALYGSITRARRRSPSVAAAHAALGDVAFQQSFCDESLLRVAYRHYLASALGASTPRFPIAAYARLRLGQVEAELGALGSAARQLDLAEAEGIYPGVDAALPRARRRRLLLEDTLASVVRQAARDGTLRLLVAFEPPSASFCIQIERVAARPQDSAMAEQTRFALEGPCDFDRDRSRECVATAGCSVRGER